MKNAIGHRSSIIYRILNNIPKEESLRIEKRMSLAVKIDEAIKAKGWKNKDLANVLDKELSVITKWLSGTHNFTVDTLCDIERALDIQILNVEVKQKVQSTSLHISVKSDNIFHSYTLPNTFLNDYLQQPLIKSHLLKDSNNLLKYKA